MSEPAPCPPAAKLSGIIDPTNYPEFSAGWQAGAIRCVTAPAPIEVIEDLALLLDAAAMVGRANPPV